MHKPDKAKKLTGNIISLVWSGNLDDIREFISNEPEMISLRDEQGATLLHHVAMPDTENYRFDNQAETAELLLAAGAEVDALTTRTGETPLHWAASANSADVARILIEQGADIEALDSAGRTPLEDAVFFGASETAQKLVHCGAAISNIVLAAGLGDLTLVKKLIPPSLNGGRKLALQEAEDDARKTLEKALSIACMNGKRSVVEYLLALGVDPNSKPLDGHAARTPLHWAVYRDKAEIVKFLIHHGADLTVRDDTYKATPLDWAKIHRRNEIQHILESAANDVGQSGTR